MSAQLASARMTVEEFLVWADAREDDGRFELDDGFVVAMAPERAIHARLKLAISRALADQISSRGLPCEAFVEGLGVRVDARTSYEPDVVVQGGSRLADDALYLDYPVIVVEILSPSTAYRDLGRKLRNYFRVASIAHYLIVDPDDRVVSHRRRGEGGVVLSEDLSDGRIPLDPPGLDLAVSDLLPPPDDVVGS